MPQLHLYLPEELAQEVRRRAEGEGISVSAYLAQLVKDRLEDVWPTEYLERVVGSMEDAPLSRPAQGEFPERKFW